MGRWTERYGDSVFAKGGWTSPHVAEVHNADCDAYEARIAELEAERDEARDDERVTSELFEAACNDLGDAQDKLARIAALVKPIPVADLVDAGTEAPALLAERHRQIRAILEEEINE